MGDRANVLVKESNKDTGVYLYTHWNGTELPEVLQTALAKHWRWDDAQYLARIIFDCMTEGEHGNETGFGISTFCGDGDDRVLVVNSREQSVTCNGVSYSFEEYVHLNSPSWRLFR